MIAFFDTNVHIDLLTGIVSLDHIIQRVGSIPVRLSPVVASELLRGISSRPRDVVERIVRQLVPIEPPSWRQCWHDAGRILPRLFPHHEDIGRSRLQNDILLALTARHTGAVIVTADGHFETICRLVPFSLQRL